MENLELTQYFDKCAEIPVSGVFLPIKDTLSRSLVENGYNVALIGVQAESDDHNAGAALAPNAIRKQLYELTGNFKNIHITDLGNLKQGKKKADVYYALADVVKHLLSENVIPVVLGGTQDLTIAMAEGMDEVCKQQRISIIDSKIDLSDEEDIPSAHNYLKWILNKKEVREVNLIGLQNYYCSEWQVKKLEEKECYCKRLKDVRDKTHYIEPILRDSELLSFDMASIRQTDAPGRVAAIPNGLSNINACEIAHYAGLSDSILAYGLFGFNPSFDNSDQTAALAAQIIWHILAGIDNRYNDYPKKSIDEYRKFVIYPKVEGDKETIFYYSLTNQRWWIEIPTAEGNKIFACTQEDYQRFCNDSIPDIWMRHFMK